MLFNQMIKRLTIDIFELLALLFGIVFVYNQMVPFVNAAISLNYINGQSVSYTLYAALLLVLPFVLLCNTSKKAKILRRVFYAFSAVILAGVVSDLIKYRFFAGYTFYEGDMIFVNIMWNMPDIFGALFGIVIAALYFALGKQLPRKRRVSYVLYLSVFLLSTAVPLLYTYLSTGFLPRETWIQKAAFIIPEQLLILIALSVGVSSRRLWKEHIWN